MTQLVRIAETALLPPLDLDDPGQMLRLPPWLASMSESVAKAEDGANWMKPEIPASLMPSGPQRTAIERRIAELADAMRPGPKGATAEAVTALAGFYATGRTGDASADFTLAGYMMAVGDLPAWAVTEAARRWFRGEAGPHNYEFKPSPATLRDIALGIVSVARGMSVNLKRILAAVPAPSAIGEAEMQRVAERAQRLSSDLAASRATDVVKAVEKADLDRPMEEARKAALAADLAARKARWEASNPDTHAPTVLASDAA